MNASIHDIYYDIHGISLSDNEVCAYSTTLPTELHALAEMWGWQDTEVRGKVYQLIEDRKKNTK